MSDVLGTGKIKQKEHRNFKESNGGQLILNVDKKKKKKQKQLKI